VGPVRQDEGGCGTHGPAGSHFRDATEPGGVGFVCLMGRSRTAARGCGQPAVAVLPVMNRGGLASVVALVDPASEFLGSLMSSQLISFSVFPHGFAQEARTQDPGPRRREETVHPPLVFLRFTRTVARSSGLHADSSVRAASLDSYLVI
jgi:hypothetical protein